VLDAGEHARQTKAPVLDLFVDQEDRVPEGAQRIAKLVGHRRRQLSEGGQALGPQRFFLSSSRAVFSLAVRTMTRCSRFR
jgi:hypothetical protein